MFAGEVTLSSETGQCRLTKAVSVKITAYLRSFAGMTELQRRAGIAVV